MVGALFIPFPSWDSCCHTMHVTVHRTTGVALGMCMWRIQTQKGSVCVRNKTHTTHTT